MSEIATRGIPPELAKGGLLGPVQTRPFLAQSLFSLKENRFGVGLRLRRAAGKQQGPRNQRQPRTSLAQWGAEG